MLIFAYNNNTCILEDPRIYLTNISIWRMYTRACKPHTIYFMGYANQCPKCTS